MNACHDAVTMASDSRQALRQAAGTHEPDSTDDASTRRLCVPLLG